MRRVWKSLATLTASPLEVFLMLSRRAFFAAAVLAALLAAAAPAQQEAADWRDLADQAEEASRRSDHTAAESLFAQAEAAAEATGTSVLGRAELHERFGDFRYEWDEYEAASSLYGAALTLREGALPAGDALLAVSYTKLGHAAWEQGQLEVAENRYRQALDDRVAALGESHFDTAESYLQLGWFLLQQDEREAAEAMLEKAEAGGEAGSDDPFSQANLLSRVGAAYHDGEIYDRSDALRDRALEILRTEFGPENIQYAVALSDAAQTEGNAERWEEAQRLYEQALEILEDASPPVPPELAAVYRKLAWVAGEQGQTERQEELLKTAIEKRREAGPDGVDVAVDLSALGDFYRSQEPGLAIVAYRAAEVILVAEPPDEAQGALVYTWASLVEVYEENEQDIEAEQVLRRWLNFAEGRTGPSSPAVVFPLRSLGEQMSKQERYAEAVAFYERLVEVETDPEQRSQDIVTLSGAYAANGQVLKAITVLQRVDDAPSEQEVDPFWESEFFQKKWMGLSIAVWIALGSTLGMIALLVASIFGVRNVMAEVAPESEPIPVAPVGSAVFLSGAVTVEPFPAPPPPLVLPAEPTPAPTLHERRFLFFGEGGSLFGIWVVNVLLTIVTFGVYYFWGKTRVRRYLWANAELDGDRFAYHGTGNELFRGFLKAVPFLFFIFFGDTLLALVWDSPTGQVLVSLGVVLLVVTLIPIAQVGAHRYRLSRTSWRGVRFSFRGSTKKYLALFLSGSMISLATFGLWTPWFDACRRKYLLERSRFGSRRFSFDGEGVELFGPWILALALALPSLGASMNWYTAARERYFWSRTSYGGARLACSLTGWQLFALAVTNFWLWLLTLGLAGPWIITRTARLWVQSIRVEGDLDLSLVEQDGQAAGATAEGFADFFGLDFGF